MTTWSALRVHAAYLLRSLALGLARAAQVLLRTAARAQPPARAPAAPAPQASAERLPDIQPLGRAAPTPRLRCPCAACRAYAAGIYVEACRRNAALSPGGLLREVRE